MIHERISKFRLTWWSGLFVIPGEAGMTASSEESDFEAGSYVPATTQPSAPCVPLVDNSPQPVNK